MKLAARKDRPKITVMDSENPRKSLSAAST